MKRPTILVYGLATLTALVGCGACGGGGTSSGGAAVTTAVFVAPATLDDLNEEAFFDHPWPSDLRLEADGSIHADGFYNPTQLIVLQDYLAATKGKIHGFSPAAAIYMRFTADLDPQTLPSDPTKSLDPSASVQIVDIDPKSPEHGKRRLAQTFFRAEEGVYWREHTLAITPALGYPLRPSTRYAIVVTTDAKDTSGHPVAPNATLSEVLGTTAPTDATANVRTAFTGAVDELAAAGVTKDRIAHLTVMTTGDPTSEVIAIAKDVHASMKPPTATGFVAKEQTNAYDAYEGTYGPSPNYQAGTPPYRTEGGDFVFDASGHPIVQNTYDQRFVLVVPNATACPAPTAGYPIAVYAHGTGGDYRSMVSDGTAGRLAEKCIASIGVDQIFHGTRPGAPPESDPTYEDQVDALFFNLNNIAAARCNGRQSAIDVVHEARLFTETKIAVPQAVSRTGADIQFDGSRMVFFGHSQGSLNGALFLAIDPSARGGILSGAGSMLTVALLEKTEPQPSVAQAVRALLGLTSPDKATELNEFHPILNLAQTFVDAIDPIHYARLTAAEPLSGNPPKSVLVTEGVRADGTGDSYAPPHGIELGAVAMGVPRLLPGTHPVTEAAWSGLADIANGSAGISGNLAGGKATGVLAQFVPPPDHDGHFVAFDVPEAQALTMAFERSLVDAVPAKIPPQ
jgi:hypothetical protein